MTKPSPNGESNSRAMIKRSPLNTNQQQEMSLLHADENTIADAAFHGKVFHASRHAFHRRRIALIVRWSFKFPAFAGMTRA
jgi:hypothetical protein